MDRVYSVVGVLGACCFIVLSAAMNYQFMSGWGFELGVLSVAADGFKAVLPLFILWGWKNGHFGVWSLGAVGLVLLVGLSLASAVGYVATSREAVTGATETLKSQHQALAKELEGLREQQDGQPRARAVAVIEQAVKAAEQNRHFSSSASCTDATVKASREFCAEYFTLKGELAGGKERDRLQGQIDGLKGRMGKLVEQGALKESDPQTKRLAEMTGQSRETVKTVIFGGVAVLVELISVFGLYLATAHGGNGRAEAAREKKPLPRGGKAPIKARAKTPVEKPEPVMIEAEAVEKPEPLAASTPLGAYIGRELQLVSAA